MQLIFRRLFSSLSVLGMLLSCHEPILTPPTHEYEGKSWGTMAPVTEKPNSATFNQIEKYSEALRPNSNQNIKIAFPIDGSIYPPEFIAPRFSWTDSDSGNNRWLIVGKTTSGKRFYALTESPTVSMPDIDTLAVSLDVPPQVPNPNRFRNWQPSNSLWDSIKTYSKNEKMFIHIYGFKSTELGKNISYGKTSISTSHDSVGAPIFFRDVPIMPSKNKTGRVQPLSKAAERLIHWSLRDVSRTDTRVLLPTSPTCANCHSFSNDGKTMAMDIDGPQNDKGSYGVTELKKHTQFKRENVFSWNYDFKNKPKDKKTIGFLSRISPDGQYIASTVNEEIYIHNYMNHKYIQVFYPTRGVIAIRSQKNKTINVLPGADDTMYVHCDPTWTPDGKFIVFSRAIAKDAYTEGQPDPKQPNDPNETQIQYSLYIIPFNDGKGGKATPIIGASDNGFSNSFPKITPDGKYIVWVRCKNGQLLRPDSKLMIVPIGGGTAREMVCNTPEMNSWHSFSPNGKWMVFSSKGYSPYTQLFLTHLSPDGMDSPPILIPNTTAANRAANLPEFVNTSFDEFEKISLPAVSHMKYLQESSLLLEQGRPEEAMAMMQKALDHEPDDFKFRSEVEMLLGWMQSTSAQKIAMTKKAIQSDSTNGNALYNLGLLLENEGNIEQSLQAYQKAIAINPRDVWSMIKIAQIFLYTSNAKWQNKSEALIMLEKANSIARFREPAIQKILARAYSEFGRFEDAISIASGALKISRESQLPETEDLTKEIDLYKNKISYSKRNLTK